MWKLLGVTSAVCAAAMVALFFTLLTTPSAATKLPLDNPKLNKGDKLQQLRYLGPYISPIAKLSKLA